MEDETKEAKTDKKPSKLLYWVAGAILVAVAGELEGRSRVRLLAGLRLVIERVELGGTTAHAEEDHPLGPGTEERGPRGEAGSGGARGVTAQGGQRQITKTARSGLQQCASGERIHTVREGKAICRDPTSPMLQLREVRETASLATAGP